jgi:hypothetical protein
MGEAFLSDLAKSKRSDPEGKSLKRMPNNTREVIHRKNDDWAVARGSGSIKNACRNVSNVLKLGEKNG